MRPPSRFVERLIETVAARLRPLRRALGGALASLKWRLTLGAVLALALAITVATAAMLRRAESDLAAAQRHSELSEAARTAAVLTRRLIELQRVLQATAAQLDAATLADERQLSRFLEARSILRTMFRSIVVAANDGRTLARLDAEGVRHPTQSLADRPYFRGTLLEGRPMVSDPIASRFTGEPVVALTYPLKAPDGTNGVLIGTLQLDNRDLLADLVESNRTESQALRVVTDVQGRILAHPDRSRLLHNLADDPRFKTAYAAWVSSGQAVEPDGLTLHQSGDLITAAGVANVDWVVWRALPEAELLAPLKGARLHALAWGAGLLPAMSVLALVLIGIALKPLALLERSARRLFDGTATAADWPSARGEIGSLSKVLQQVGIERQRMEAARDQSLLRLQSVMAAAPIGIVFTRGQRIELVSEDLCRMFGHPESALLGQPAQMFYASVEEYQAVGPKVVQAFQAGLPFADEYRMRRADGTEFWAQLRGRPVDSADPAAGTIWSMLDISGEVALRTHLHWSATHDALTGLANRHAFDERLGQLFQSMPGTLPAALIAIDLDHFKPINDGAGHAAGDEMLKAVAVAIRSRVRSNDLVVRTGGDEFAVLLEHCGAEAAQRVAASIREGIRGIELPWGGRRLRVGASIGVAPLQPSLHDAQSWKRAADDACYAAKAASRTGGVSRRGTAPAASLAAPRP